jgi:hypothetical protein
VPDDLPTVTVEILKQIRDGIAKLESNLGTRIDALGSRVDALGTRIDAVGARVDAVRTELKGELTELRGVVMLHGRIVDNALQVSLEDSGRLEAIEGRPRTPEHEVQALRQRG